MICFGRCVVIYIEWVWVSLIENIPRFYGGFIFVSNEAISQYNDFIYFYNVTVKSSNANGVLRLQRFTWSCRDYPCVKVVSRLMKHVKAVVQHLNLSIILWLSLFSMPFDAKSFLLLFDE